MNKLFSQSFISFALYIATIIILAITPVYAPNASAYGYLATSEALTSALDKSPYSEDQKYELYKHLIIFLPLIQQHITNLEKIQRFTRDRLDSIKDQLFAELFPVIIDGATHEHVVALINISFNTHGSVASRPPRQELSQFIIETTSTRFFKYIMIMMRGELSPLLANRAIFYHEQLLMRHYSQDMVTAIIQLLHQQFDAKLDGLVKQLNLSSVKTTIMVCQAIVLLGSMIEYFSHNKELVITLKQKFNKAVFNHHAHRHQRNPDVLNNLIRLTMSLHIPQFTRQPMLASPSDYPAVMLFLENYMMYLRNLPHWRDTLVQSLFLDLAITSPQQSSATEPEEFDRSAETLEESDSDSLLQLVFIGSSGSSSTMATGQVIIEEDEAPILEDMQGGTERATQEDEAQAEVKPEVEKTGEEKNDSPEPVKEKKTKATEAESASPPARTYTPKPRTQRDAAYRRKKEREKKEAKKKLELLRQEAERKTQQEEVSVEKPETPTPADEETKTPSPTTPATDDIEFSSIPEESGPDHLADAADVKKDLPVQSKTKKAKKQHPPKKKGAPQKPSESTSAASPFNTGKEQTPAASTPNKKDTKSSRRRARKKQKTQTEQSGISTFPLPQETEVDETSEPPEGHTGRQDSPDWMPPVKKKESGKTEKPQNLTIPDLHPRALSFLNYLLTAIQQNPETMLLTGSNAGQLMLRELYSHDPEYGPVWDFTTSDAAFLKRFSKLFKLLPLPFMFTKHITSSHVKITLSEKREGGLETDLISFRFIFVKKTQPGWSSYLSPFNKLSIHNPTQQLEVFESLLQQTDPPSVQNRLFLKQWRQLEKSKSKLSKKLNDKLYALGKGNRISYDEDPVLDEHIRQSLPDSKPEDTCRIHDDASLPGKLICTGCKKPKYHSLQLPCGYIMCRQCVEQSTRDITCRLICPASNCPEAHYPSECFRDGACIRQLKTYADPATTPPRPETNRYLKDTQEWQSKHSSPLPFQLLLIKTPPEDQPDEATCKASEETLSKFLITDEAASPSLVHLSAYHTALIVYATCYGSLQTPASQQESLTRDIKRRTLTRNIINHSYDLVQESLALLEPNSGMPGFFINIAVVWLDVALIHSQNLQYIQSLCSAKSLPSKLKLLKDIPSGAYPQLMEKIRHWIAQYLHPHLTDEPLFMLLRFSQTFPSILDEKNHPTLFGDASPAVIFEALLTHLSLIGIAVPLGDQLQHWHQFLTYLSTKMQDLLASTEHDSQNIIRFSNLLAEQISVLLTNLSHRAYYSQANKSPTEDDTTQRHPQLIDVAILFFTEIRTRVIAQTEQPNELHSFILNPDILKQRITESRQLRQESISKAGQLRTEQMELWAEQKQLLLKADQQERAALDVLKEIAKKTETKVDYTLTWNAFSEFEEQQNLLNDTAILAHYLLFMQKQLPPSGPELPYQQFNPNEFLQVLGQLQLQADTLTATTPSLVRYYQMSIYGLMIHANLEVMLDSLEHVQMMEASLNYFRTRMEAIGQNLESSHQTFARWHRMQLNPTWDVYDRKASAQLMGNLHDLRNVIREILKKASMTSAWLEKWHRTFDEMPLPLPKKTPRPTRLQTAHLMNNLPPGYELHWVTPNGNCLYEAILMGQSPTRQPPSHDQMAKLRKKLNQLLKKIINTIKEAPQDQRSLLWEQLSSLMGLSMDNIQTLINDNIIETPVAGPMDPETALSLFGDMGFVAPLAILHLGIPLSTMSVANPANSESWIQHHMNIFSTWLHHAPQLLAALVDAGTITLDHFEHGAQISLALTSQDPNQISELVTQNIPTQAPFALVHTGSSEDCTGHFFLATHAAPVQPPQVFSIEVFEEQMQNLEISGAALVTLLGGMFASKQ